MDEEDGAGTSDLSEDLANVVKSLGPVFRKSFPNVRRAIRRLTGDVSDAAMDALVARLRRSRTHQQMETINEVSKTFGLPAPVVARAFAEQKLVDELLASALKHLASQDDGGSAPAASNNTTADDWFEVYRREAVDRSLGDLREAFVRILAGEIQSPGSFSVRTLRVLGMLDQRTAALFRKAASVSVRLELLTGESLSRHIQDARIPSLGGSLGANSLAEHGLDYRTLTRLTEAELIHSEYASSASYGPAQLVTEDGKTVSDPTDSNLQFPMIHQGSRWLLRPNSESRQGKPIDVIGAMFTSVGVELLPVVDIVPMPAFTEQLQRYFASVDYSMVPYSRRGKRA